MESLCVRENVGSLQLVLATADLDNLHTANIKD